MGRVKYILSKPIRAISFTLLLSALIGAAAFPLSGCTTKKTDEMIIRESVAEVLNNFKSSDGDMAQRFISEMDIKELGSIGLNTTDFMKAYSDNFSYEVSDIRITGDTAEADITIYVKSFSEFEERFEEEVKILSKKYMVVDTVSSSDSGSATSLSDGTSLSPSSLSSNTSNSLSTKNSASRIKVTTAEMNAMFARTIINCMKETPVKEAETITIQFTNTNNTWKPSPTAMDDILTAMIEN